MEYTLKQWRNIRGVSQEQLAEAIGITNQTISNWETGKTNMKYSDVLKVRKALDLAPEDAIKVHTD